MADLAISATITRTELGLTALELNDQSAYTIARGGFGHGDITFRRLTADSPWIEGRALVHAVKEQVTIPLVVRVHGSSSVNLHSRTSALVRALEQYKYRLKFMVNGIVQAEYICEPADYSIGDGGVFQDLHYRSLVQEVSAQIPRMPTPVAGIA